MRDRYDQAESRFDSTGTLERLQDALIALEQRVGPAPKAPARSSRPAVERDIAAIRARRSEVEAGLGRRPERPARDRRADALRNEIGRLRKDVSREMTASAGGFEALRDEMRGKRAAQGSASRATALRAGTAVSVEAGDLRAEIEQLKNGVAALAREDTLRDLTERWTVIEREIAALPDSLASRDDLSAVSARLEDMHDRIGDLPRTLHLDMLEEHLRALAEAVEQVALRSAVAVPAGLDDLDARLDEISRAIGAMAPVAPAGLDTGAIERVEARIAALANQIDAYAHDHPPVDYGERFEELAARIDGLRLGVAPGTVSGEAMDMLNARIDSIADSLDALARAETLGDGQARFAVSELDERLAAIDAQIRSANALAERSAEDVVRSVDDRMTEIARRIDQNEQAQQSVPSIAQLDQRLDQIAAMLASGSASAAPVDTTHLESQIADLSAALARGGSTSVDEERIWTAARTAAEEVASRMVAAGGENAMPETLEKLTGDLRTLESLARDTDSRNAETFEAIHDTLLQVVDHLASLEDKIRATPGSGAPSAPMPEAAPMPAAAPMHIDDAPPLETVFDSVEPGDHAEDAPMSPARAAADAALFALGERPEPAPAADRPSFLKSVAGRLPLGRGRKEQTPANMAESFSDEGDALPPVVDDQPIEPGGDQLALADIMARVRAERKGAGSAPALPGEVSGPGADTGKSDFIAAARRAAQAAAADAGAMTSGSPAPGEDGSGSIVGAISRRRKPILMAAGAILLAILAVPLVRGFIAPGNEAVVAQAPEPPAIVETLPDEDGSAEASEIAASETTPSRDVLAEADAAAEPDAAGMAAPELAAAAPDPVETPDVEDVETATVTSFDDLPGNVGSVALREAVAEGDAMALYVVGERLADAARGGDGDLSEALKWYERAAELGFAPAQYRTGNFYEKGFGAERDFSTAKTWYQLAAEQGNASAMHNLAVLFASGADGPPDFDSAARWFLRAAELGVRDSQFNLGILAAKGQGMPQDLGESYKWFALAAQSGDEDAAAKRDDIANVLRPDQLETARGATALWRAKPIDERANRVDVPEAWQTGDTVTAAAAPISDEDMRRAVANIQAILNDNGYDAGPVDGLMGRKTRDAIIAFQRDNGLPATGNVDQSLVENLLALAQTES
ncbi:hypothetical protein DEM25_004505 [Oceaniradius stylonematis]|uniref:Peptidoglycan binding-like domain-containing protein n=1 Tax=Oceaniradius stylonematis TaxID=2184161 RepID=A0A3A8A9W3_9HYPH|nr:peptidoglycan-binding protein [Oceaniradius stylonematis]RKF07122.1 hypothetical protein DEM25_004505 [Oceaniradius stylonematis]